MYDCYDATSIYELDFDILTFGVLNLYLQFGHITSFIAVYNFLGVVD
jgi:hypothetical protein